MMKMTNVARNIAIFTEERFTDGGKGTDYITTVENTATKEQIDFKRAANWDDALQDHEDMITTYALPLQAAVHAARMEKGSKYTIAFLGDFGLPVALQFTFDRVEYKHYAQYDDAVALIFTPAGKRKLRMMNLYNRSFVLCEGWRELDKHVTMNIDERPNGITVSSGKYCSFDERYMDDIAAAWSDAKVIYRINLQPEPKPEPKPEPVREHEIVNGITVLHDEEHGLCVGMEPDTFAAVYAQPADGLSVEDKLIRALNRAAIASAAHAEDEDGGTCNFDSPVLDYAAAGLSRDDAERIIGSVGLASYDWEKMLVITGCFSGQGNRRTKMAETFMHSMIESGFPSCMYYQMD